LVHLSYLRTYITYIHTYIMELTLIGLQSTYKKLLNEFK
jgi:hypothetical protein